MMTAGLAERRRPAFADAVHAISADSQLLTRDPCELAGIVHSAFDRVINVRASDGSLWALAAQSVPNAPSTVRIDVPTLARYRVSAGEAVAVRGGTLTVALRLAVRLTGATPWDPIHAAGPVDPARLARAEDALSRFGVHPADAAPLLAATISRVTAAIAQIGCAVRRCDIDGARNATARIVGLGIGLTPTGDDVLTGLAFAAADLGGPLDIIRKAVEAAAEAGATHDLSLAMVRAACRGRASDPLAALLAAIRGNGAAADVDLLMADLTRIGHTSGMDQAQGLLAAVRIFTGMRGM